MLTLPSKSSVTEITTSRRRLLTGGGKEETLDQFLQGPRKMVPGTKMTYAGIANPQDRADLIAYLKQATK